MIFAFEYDDYDGDGLYEAFGFTTPGETDGYLYSDVNIWFLDSSGNCNLIFDNTYGYLHDEKLVADNQKFMVWEQSGGGSGSTSYVFGVKNGAVYEPAISGNYMSFGTDLESGTATSGVFYGYTSDFSKGYHDYIPTTFIFDAASGEFVES